MQALFSCRLRTIPALRDELPVILSITSCLALALAGLPASRPEQGGGRGFLLASHQAVQRSRAAAASSMLGAAGQWKPSSSSSRGSTPASRSNSCADSTLIASSSPTRSKDTLSPVWSLVTEGPQLAALSSPEAAARSASPIV